MTIYRLDVLLSRFGTSLFISNLCFLTCIQISQEASQVVWYSQHFKNFSVCCDPHIQRLWYKEVDAFLEFSCFFYDPADVGNLMAGPYAVFKSILNILKFSVHVLLKPRLANFEHYFASVCCSCCLFASVVSDTATPRTAALQAPPSMGLSRQEY